VKISRRTFMLLAGGMAGAALSCSYLETNKLTVTRLKFGLGSKIAFLADTHIHSLGWIEEEIIKKLEEESPDVVLHGGDIIDEFTSSLDPVRAYLSAIEAEEKYAVLGNHDHWCRRTEELVRLLKDCGFRLLLDEVVKTRIGRLAGIDWRDDRNYSIEFDADILLVHDPNAAAKAKKAELILAGHTHGGVVVGGLTLLSNSIYTRGLYDLENNRKLYVSRGLGQMIPLRPTSPLELVMIE